MNPRRRRFLLVAFGALGLSGVFVIGGWWRQIRMRAFPVSDTERSMLRRLVDVLVPRDETAGALDFGIDQRLIAEVERNRPMARRIAEACHWLDRQAGLRHGRRFLELAADETDGILAAMAATGRLSIPHDTFWWLRDRVMDEYYTRAETWAPLGLEGPPQPLGYPDYDQPPHGAPA